MTSHSMNVSIQMAGGGQTRERLVGAVLSSLIKVRDLEIDLGEVLEIKLGVNSPRMIVLRNGSVLYYGEKECDGFVELQVPGIKQVQRIPLFHVEFLKYVESA